jgi:hypothetical protein
MSNSQAETKLQNDLDGIAESLAWVRRQTALLRKVRPGRGRKRRAAELQGRTNDALNRDLVRASVDQIVKLPAPGEYENHLRQARLELGLAFRKARERAHRFTLVELALALDCLIYDAEAPHVKE